MWSERSLRTIFYPECWGFRKPLPEPREWVRYVLRIAALSSSAVAFDIRDIPRSLVSSSGSETSEDSVAQ